MRKVASPVWVSGIVVSLAFFYLLSGYLTSYDVSLNGYLSGLMLNVLGGEENQLIRVNLHNHSIALYQSGTLYKLAKIAGTGNPNNSTATPTGKFRVLSKEVRHVNSHRIIMPFSMRFSNKGYYLHDIPLTMAGVKITSTYSNGCIRLPTDLAQEMFGWTNVGAYVEIYDASLARAAGTTRVYSLTADGMRVPILSEAEFIAHGYKWKDVAIIPYAELEGLPLVGTNASILKPELPTTSPSVSP